jgi:hypothetical protein
MRTRNGTRCLALSLSLLSAAPMSASAAEPLAASPQRRAPAALEAYAQAQKLVKDGELAVAVDQLDLATELEPEWAEPVRLRAEIFGTLADRHHPSEIFTSARAADLQRLLVLEPGVDTAARQHELASLRKQTEHAHKVEARRRKLMTPALIGMTASVALVISGAMLYSMKPNDFLKPSAYRYENRDAAGLGMLIAGAIVLPPAIVLCVLAGKQARRDSAARDFNVETRRPRATVGLTPQYVHSGGGMGVKLRF